MSLICMLVLQQPHFSICTLPAGCQSPAPPQAGVQPGLDDSIKAGDSAPAYGGQIAADAPYLALSGQDLDRQDDAASVLSGGAQSSWVAMRAYSICTACYVACKQGS
jgi:hypothetical protein